MNDQDLIAATIAALAAGKPEGEVLLQELTARGLLGAALTEACHIDREREGRPAIKDLAHACGQPRVAEEIESFLLTIINETCTVGGDIRERAENAEGQLSILRGKALRLIGSIQKRDYIR